MGNRVDKTYRSVLAWGVHLLTAGGALAGFMSVLAIVEERWVASLAWLMVAAAIDSFDGKLARILRVKDVLPGFDGALLDNLVDYFTYVIVPALFLCKCGLLPDGFGLAGAAMIVLASAYQFCQIDAKTADHYFKGFPSYWNVLALYLFLLRWEPWLNFAVVTVFAALVFVPIKYLYPSRTRRLRRLTVTLAALWAASMIVLLAQYPEVPAGLLWGSFAFVAYYAGASVILSMRDATQSGRRG